MDPRQQYDALINAILKAAGSGGLYNFTPYNQDRIREAAAEAMRALNPTSSGSKEA